MTVISGGKVIEGAQYRTSGLATANTADNPVAYGALQWARATYSFAVQGGAVSTIALVGTTVIPNNAEIILSGIDVRTAPTSGGSATIAVQVEAANDIVSAAAISGAPWSTTGRKNGVPVSYATSVKTTAARDISIVIGTAALTAGIFDVYVAYIVVA